MRHILFAAIFSLGHVGAASAQDAVRVPFDMLATRHMVVEAKVNGKGPFRLIFDTGAPTTLVSTKLAREAGVIDPKAIPFFALFGNQGQKKLKDLQLGGLELHDVDAMVLDHPIVTAIGKTLKEPIEGIIGLNVFGRYRMTIDYQAKVLTFAPGTFVPVDIMQVMIALVLPSVNDLKSAAVIGPGGLLGLQVEKAKDDPEDGVTIKHVFPGSAADRAGLRAGDRLLTIDGRWTDQAADCLEAARHLRPGRRVPVEVFRDGRKRTLTVEPAAGV